MKSLFIAILMVVGIASFSQDTTSTERIYKDAKQSIVEVANQLKGPAEHVYKTYVRQQVVSSIVSLMIFGASLIIFIVILIYCSKKAEWDAGEAENGYAVCSMVCWAFIVIWLLVFIICAGDIITSLINPEYYAISDLLEDIRGEY